jgi:ribosomal protein S18 acetylase RimI-like enzyme
VSSVLKITESNGDRYVQLEQYRFGIEVGHFSCPIAELAVSSAYADKYMGVGSFMITSAHTIARHCDKDYFSCRFLTVDADIEHDNGVLGFYEKNGFVINSELSGKKQKTISMRKDIYFDVE